MAGASSPVAKTLTRHYDTLLRPAGMELKDGTTVDNAVSYGYDTAGRLQSLSPSYPLPGAPDFTYNYQANSYGLVQSVTGPAHTVTNAWETTRNVLAVKTNADLASTPVTVSAYDYSVNNIGQRESLATSGTAYNSDFRTLDWDYDARGQVVAEDDSGATPVDRAFEFDAIGNRKKSADSLILPTTDNYVANPLNQYTAVQLASSQLVPGYDDDGNLLDDAGINTGTSGDRNFIWDAENRLIEVKDESDGTTIATYAYDYIGRRVRKTVTSGEDTVFLYDGWNVVAEYDVTTTPTLDTTYTWGMDLSGSMQGAGGVGGLLAVNDGTNTFYPTYDGNGNVSEYLNSSGANIAHYEYDAFGNIVKATGNSEDFRYRFSTKPLDSEIGWYYYGYRYYDPLTGRWPSRDPIGEKGGVNLYGFVNNDSLFGFDLLGYKKGIPFDLRGFAQNLAVAAAVQVLANFSVKLDILVDHLPMACRERMLDTKDIHADYPFSISKGTPAVSSYRDFGAKVLEIFVDGFLGGLGKKYIKGDGLPIGVDPQGQIAEKILDAGIEALPGELRKALKNAVLETTGGELIIKNASDNCSVNARFSILMKIKVPGLDDISFRQEVMSGDFPNTITAIQQKCQLKPAVIKKNK